ncbi:MAG: hypothetical protein ACRDHU_03280 [Actinomycetota bacterium]
MTVALVLIGLAAAGAGLLGVLLPAGDRIAAVLALVVGAGIGVVTLAIGAQVVGEAEDAYEDVFLMGSVLGFVGTSSSLALLWRRARRVDDPR